MAPDPATRRRVACGLVPKLRRAALLLIGLLASGAVPAWGNDSLLLGAWEGGDRASQARYGRILVRQTYIKWTGSRANPGCRVGYRLVARDAVDRYPDAVLDSEEVPRADAAAPRYTVFRLALQKRACAAGRSALQFAIPTATPDRAELITYDALGRPVSWGHLNRPPSH